MSSRRKATLVIGRPLLLRPFTSVMTTECTKTPNFEYVCVGHREDTDTIDIEVATWPEQRFVYVFLSKSKFPDPATLAGRLTRDLFDSDGVNPLMAVVRVMPGGAQSVLVGQVAREAATQPFNTLPFKRVNAFEWAGLEPEQLEKEIGVSYAVASPFLLPLEAIEQLEKDCPKGVPTFGLGMGIASRRGDIQTPNHPQWVFPVVDPIYITRNLTQKYSDACDAYWSQTRVYDPDTRKWGGPTLDVFKKGVADALVAMRGESRELAGAASGQPDAFLEKYKTFERDAIAERETAALILLQWLNSDIVKLADTWFRDVDGVPGPNYACYLNAIAEAHARLHESDTGLTYLTGALDASQQNQGNPGPLRVLGEFVLPTEPKTTEHIKNVLKCGNAIVSAWAAFMVAVEAQVSSRTKMVFIRGTAKVQVQELYDAVEMMLVPLNVWFAEGEQNRFVAAYAEVERRVQVSVLVEKKVNFLLVTEVKIPMSPQLEARLAKANIAKDRVNSIFATINLGLSYFALREAFAKEDNTLGRIGSVADIVAAVLASADDATTGAQAVNLSRRLLGAGKLTEAAAKVSSSRLGLAGSVLSLVSASTGAVDKYAAGDWDAAAAQGVQGVGSAISAVGYALLLNSPEGGPFAPWVVVGGSVVSLSGLVWSFWADDTAIEQWVKFCALGQQAGAAATAPEWALCKSGNFSDWDPNTIAGLKLQLLAAKQLQFSFIVQWNNEARSRLAKEVCVRITPGSMRGDAVFHIEFDATWDEPYTPRRPLHTVKGAYCRVSFETKEQKLVAVLRNHSGFIQETQAVVVSSSGKNPTIDITLRPRDAAVVEMGPDGKPLDAPKPETGSATKTEPIIELRDFKCSIRLDVNGDGSIEKRGADATLIVPSNHAGGRRITAELMRESKILPAASSLNKDLVKE